MAYIYKHIRLDTNEVFYVGIGVQDEFKRAFTKQKRNKFWHNIVNKTSYTIVIVEDNLSWEEACLREKELIIQYGRRDLSNGTLVNMTDGGDGTINVKHTNEWYDKQKMNNNKKGKKISEVHKQRISEHHKSKNKDVTKSGCIPIDVYDLNGKLLETCPSIIEAAKKFNVGRATVDRHIVGKYKRPYKYIFKKAVD